MAFSNPYPADVAGIDRQAVENMIFDDIINHDYNRRTKVTLLLCMRLMQDKISDDEDYWAQIEGNEEWEKAQKEARYKIARAAIDAWKAKRDNPQKEEEEEEEKEEAEEEEDEEDEDEEEDYEEEYDDEEEETEESEGSEESGDEESDDGSDWDSLFLLVHNMPTENDEPKSTARKRSLPRDDTPCPPPRPQPAKRQKLDPSAASKAPMAQDSGNDEPKPATRKRSLIAQQNGDAPAAEVPFPKRQRMDPPALVANANDEDQEQEQGQGQETKSSVPSEWLAPHQEELQNSQLPEPLRGILGRLPVSELHREAQTFLLGLKYLDPADDALAKAAIDMGLRFSKTAKSSEYNIVLDNMLRHPIQAVMYNCCREDETYHTFFWGKIRSVTGRDVPPERIRERRERRAKREAEAMARFNARKAAEEAKRESQMLKEKYVSQIGEASKLPLREKVGRWLAEIVKAEKQQ